MIAINRNRNRLWAFPRAVSGATALLLSWSLLALPARANVVANLNPVPDSAPYPAFDFGGSPIPSFDVGPGSIGNGDGGLPVNLQTPGGLELSTPFSIAPLTSYGEQNNVDGSTTFYDTTLALTGLSASGLAQSVFGFDVQALNDGTFAIFGSNVGGGDGPLLLTGTLTSNEIAGVDGSSSAAVFSTTVTYTGGPIYNALIAAGGSGTDASVNLQLNGAAMGINGGTGFLNPFSADGQALFSATYPAHVVPEPSSIVLLAFGLFGTGAAALRRRRSPA
jgi:hypothetical protein